MADNLTALQRSKRMGSIKQKDTSPELVLRKALHKIGFRYRLHASELPGRPDIVFPKYKTAIFVHGCFWHRHVNCRLATNPKSRVDFWEKKFASNVERDARNVQDLHALGWRVFIVWQCELTRSMASQTAEHYSKLLKL